MKKTLLPLFALLLAAALLFGCQGRPAAPQAPGESPGESPSESAPDPGLPARPAPPDLGELQSFRYVYGSWYTTEYRLAPEEGELLFSVLDSGRLREGYPTAVDQAVLEELEALFAQYDIWSWAGEYQLEEMATDGNGYQLEAEFAGGSLLSSGYMAYPPGYWEGHQALEACLQKLVEARQNEQLEQRRAWQLENIEDIQVFECQFGDYLIPESMMQYTMAREEDGGIAVAIRRGEEAEPQRFAATEADLEAVLAICRDHGIFDWEDPPEGESSEFILINSIFCDSRGVPVHLGVHGVGAAPQGWDAFAQAVTACLEELAP